VAQDRERAKGDQLVAGIVDPPVHGLGRSWTPGRPPPSRAGVPATVRLSSTLDERDGLGASGIIGQPEPMEDDERLEDVVVPVRRPVERHPLGVDRLAGSQGGEDPMVE